jgi:hypothetical protein
MDQSRPLPGCASLSGAADLAHEQLIRGVSANDGHAAITRPVAVGSATATFAARLATLPTTNSAHGSRPSRTLTATLPA